MTVFTLTPGQLSLTDLREIYHHGPAIQLAPAAIPGIQRSARQVQSLLAQDQTVYGINTGFGLLANTKIAADQLEQLQRSIVLSHATGCGQYLSIQVVRLILVLKINSLARGHSGVRLELIERLLQLYNSRLYPLIPEQGSVGASGDLAPLAHLAAPLIGEGEVFYNDQHYHAAEGLALASFQPITLAPKEGLALLNGTQVSTALALVGLFESEQLLNQAIAIGASSVEAAMGSRTPFDARIHQLRGLPTQITVANAFRELLTESSAIAEAHKECDKVQDPYSLRCQPQVLGACYQQIVQAAAVLHQEANGVTDNPLLFFAEQEVLSGGNFHAEPVAMVADNLALAIAEIGSLSERRIALLIDANHSNLPAFLVQEGGVNSGFMIAHVTAAALASENKSLAHPASVDSLPTSANQEDHVSMATFAARRLQNMVLNTRQILAIEYLAAMQGLDLRALRSTNKIEQIKYKLRQKVSFYAEDRFFAPDIRQATALLAHDILVELETLPLLK